MFTYPENWNSMSMKEKQEARLAPWLSPEIEFATEEAEAAYKRRTQRLKDVCQLKTPDRVPAIPLFAGVVADHTKVTHGEMMYDYDKAVEAIINFHEEYQPDYQAAANFLPGKVFDVLGLKTYRWPGDGLPGDVTFQMVEKEYMTADEYDQLIADPESFYMRTYMPRAFEALEGWAMLPSFYGSMEFPMIPIMMAPVSAPPVQQAFKAFLEAANATAEWLGASAKMGGQLVAGMGLPATAGGFSKAPFDIIGDTLRGTRGIMMDLYRHPDKVIAACERLVPIAVQLAVQAATGSGNPFILVPLHKGADGFMSNEQFETFYWPTLKATILGIVEEGAIPWMFVEGGYNQRLEIIAESDLPPGTTMWMFDQTAMEHVKETFGDWACFGGNVPASLLHSGTPEQVEDYVKGLIDTVGQDGGYFLSPGVVVDQAKPENLHAYIKTAREYGVY